MGSARQGGGKRRVVIDAEPAGVVRPPSHWRVGKMTLLNKKTLAVLAITVAALPIFALFDPQSTVQIKATFINLLPIDAQRKTDAIKNLCQAAYAGNSSFERFDCISSLSRE
jgi:hypothetical protein